MAPRICVVGSVNLDLVARCERLPEPGETIGGAVLQRVPGGKGANQAVAAARLGAEVTFVGRVGADDLADEALAGLEEAGVELRVERVPGSTGIALITVAADGENTIVVAPGANALLTPADVADLPASDALLCQLEVPVATVAAAATGARFVCLNASPLVQPEAPPADLTVVNRREHEVLGPRPGLVAVTHGSEGAVLLENGEEVARAAAPPVQAVDGTAAGDAFAAALLVSLLEERPREEALRRACAAGALAASRPGAQPSLPTAAAVDEAVGA